LKRQPKSLEDLLADESYHRFVNGKATEFEKLEWNEWINQNPVHFKLHNSANKILKNMRIHSTHHPNVRRAREKLEKELTTKNDLSSIDSLINKTDKGFSWKAFIRMAAVITLALLTSYYIWGNYKLRQQSHKVPITTQSLTTDYGVQKTLKLSDGSSIILAPNSSLTFASDWLSRDIKKISLQGEAYFNIKGKNRTKNKPEFEISTPDGIIRDFGTQFNVSTFNSKTSVVLEKGIVSVLHKNKEDEIRLKPKQMAVIWKNHPEVSVMNVNPKVYTSWTTHVLYFDHTPLRDLAQTLTNRYGVTIVASDPALLDKKLSGAIDKTDLKSLLAVVSRVLHIKMTLKSDTIRVQNMDMKTSQNGAIYD
jgi:ferric-dicitrate binding protein FerR (iron transport regulator)